MTAVNGFTEYRQDRPRPMIVAHRGASALAPENTISSFSRALEIGADAVEFDIHQSSDGRLVVMHDESLERTTNGSGFIRDTDSNVLRGLDAGSWYASGFRGERIPTLEEALDFITPAAYALVEIKHGNDVYPGIEKKIAELMSLRKSRRNRTVFIAFDPEILLNIRELDAELSTGLLTADPPDDYIDVAEEFLVQCFFPKWERLRNESVSLLHKNGYSVHPWVIDREEDAVKVISMKPDSVSSNHPDMLKRIVGGG